MYESRNKLKQARRMQRSFWLPFVRLGDALAAGETVQIIGTGSFTVRETPAHKGFNPVTQQPIEVAAKKSPVFKPGKTLKEKVNGTIA